MTALQQTDETRSEPTLLAEVRLTPRVASLLAIVSTGAFVCSAAFFEFVRRSRTGDPLPITTGTITVSAPTEMLANVLPLAALLLGLTAVHELLHGVSMSRYGARATYGVGRSYLFPYAYASGDGTVYTRNQLFVVLLAPLVVISIAGVLVLAAFPSELLVLALAANAAGSMADCWIAAALVRFSPAVRIDRLPEPRASGFAIYGERDDAVVSATSARRTMPAFLAGAFATLGALLVGCVLAVFHAAATGTGTVVLGDPSGFWFLFGHEFDPGTGLARFEVGRPLVLAAAAIGGIVAALVPVLRVRLS